jgi:hypothetical protein
MMHKPVKTYFEQRYFSLKLKPFTTLVQNLIKSLELKKSETKYSKNHTSASRDVLESPFKEHNCEKSDAHLTAFLNRPNM